MQTTTAPTRLMPKLLALTAVVALSACSTLQAERTAPPLTNLGNNPVFAEPLDKSDTKFTPRDLATLVFFRPGTAKGNELPLNIYINGRFLTSLLPGGYVTHDNCAGPVQVAAVFDDARIRHLGKGRQETTRTIEAGKSYYFRADAIDAATPATLVEVPSSKAFLGEYRRQSHVLTRAPNCSALPVVAAAPVAAVVAAPVVAAVLPAAMPAAETVRAPLESWRAAWESGNYETYKSFYAPDFKGTLASRKAWEQQRRTRLNNSAKSIMLDNLQVKTASDAVYTDFKQVYKSKQFDDIGQKRLVWKPVNGVLKIVEEGFVAK